MSITAGNSTTTFVYDGNGNRVKQVIVGGNTTLYINKYYETNNATGNTTYYYLGGRLVAKRTGTTLSYIHQDHLTGTAVVTSDNGTLIGGTSYYPYGDRLKSQGNLGTDKLFTGQRLDGTGLYYYGARYYDPAIGSFISPDVIVQNPANPQSLNRYSYVFNNPLKYVDDSGRAAKIPEDFSRTTVISDGRPPFTLGEHVREFVRELVDSSVWGVIIQAEMDERVVNNAIGVETVESISYPGADEPVMVWTASNSGLNAINKILDVFDAEGLTPGPDTVLLRGDADEVTLKHEFAHIGQARELDQQGASYLGTYIFQYVTEVLTWGTDDAYIYHPMEWEAREEAGQYQPEEPPTPWWEDF